MGGLDGDDKSRDGERTDTECGDPQVSGACCHCTPSILCLAEQMHTKWLTCPDLGVLLEGVFQVLVAYQ